MLHLRATFGLAPQNLWPRAERPGNFWQDLPNTPFVMQNLKLQRGFTLLELLVVMAIVSVLAAIAVPRYAAYRQRAFDMRSLNDLRNLATAEEVYFLENEKYLSCSDAACLALPGIAAFSKGVTINATGDDQKFNASATHPQGSGKTYNWDSDLGGLQE